MHWQVQAQNMKYAENGPMIIADVNKRQSISNLAAKVNLGPKFCKKFSASSERIVLGYTF